MCVEVILTGLYQKTKWTRNEWVPDKMDKSDSNWRRTIDMSPVRSATRFVNVKKDSTGFAKVNGHGTDALNGKHIENGH